MASSKGDYVDQEWLDEMTRTLPRLDSPGGRGNIPPMDTRVAILEHRLDAIDENLKEVRSEIHSLRWWVLGVVIGGVLTFAGIMVSVVSFQSDRFEYAMDQQAAMMQQSREDADRRLQESLSRIDERFSRVEQAIERLATQSQPTK